MRSTTTLLLSLLLLLTTQPAAAQRCVAASDMADNAAQDRWCGTSLITTRLDGTTPLGGTAGFGGNTSCLRRNDDGSSSSLTLATSFPAGLRFFDRTHSSVFVNTNGNITFSASLSTFTPNPFPVADQPMIAAFWADVDTRTAGGGCVGSVGLTCNPCNPCEPYASGQAWWDFEPGRAIFTWDEVGYYSCQTDRRQSFQIVLTAFEGCGGPGDFDVEFRYNRCEWDTGGASGGTGGFDTSPASPSAAQAGFDAGNSMDFVEIMNSRVTRTINRTLCEESNVGMPGIWQFQIRSGGVICPDAGDPCTLPAPLMGACAAGRTNCVGSGTECVQQVFPEAERCDNVDNDCNGSTDDGTDLCEAGFACRAGACVENCFESSCGGGLVCVDPGVCVEPGCETVDCPEGERCSAGVCVPACSGVTCPFGQVCEAGRCFNPCTGLTCDDCSVCAAGTCVERCTLGGTCATGETCDTATGSCIPPGCAGVTCSSGTHCVAGSCVDSCDGVTCPRGQMCTAGACVMMDRPDAGPPFDAGGPIFPDAGPTFDVGPILMDGGGIAPPDAGRPTRPPPVMGSCGCRAAGRGVPGTLALAVVLGLAIAARRRR